MNIECVDPVYTTFKSTLDKMSSSASSPVHSMDPDLENKVNSVPICKVKFKQRQIFL